MNKKKKKKVNTICSNLTINGKKCDYFMTFKTFVKAIKVILSVKNVQRHGKMQK